MSEKVYGKEDMASWSYTGCGVDLKGVQSSSLDSRASLHLKLVLTTSIGLIISTRIYLVSSLCFLDCLKS